MMYILCSLFVFIVYNRIVIVYCVQLCAVGPLHLVVLLAIVHISPLCV